MAATRTTMRKLRDVLRLRLEAGLSYRQINASTKVSVGLIQFSENRCFLAVVH